MTTIYYWSGLSEANLPILSEYPEYRGKILQLLQGETRGADLDLKRHGDYPLYTIRLNDADRLLFTTVERDGKQYILLLEVIKNHDYQKSRFLKSGVLRRYIDAHEDEISSVIGTASFIAGEASEVPVGVESSASELSAAPMMHYQDKWLTLDNSQAAASNTRDYPLLVSGPPGSGKSCIALSLLIKAMQSRESMTYKSMLCVTESVHVARHLSAQWIGLPEALDEEGNLREDVRFLTYKQLLCEILQVEESQLVDESYFEHWYAEYRSGLKRGSPSGRRSPQDPLSDVDLVYQECRVVSGCDDLSGYVGLGRSQSLFEDEETRTRVWGVYQSYQSHLLERGLIAPDFHELPNAAHFGQVVVDEAQDLSIRQLMNLHGLVDGDRIACAMDSNQNLMSRVPIGLLFQQYCYRRGLALQESMLEGTYRCPGHVVSLANGVLAVKNAAMGGASAQGEQTSIHPATSESGDGEVLWESPPVDADSFRSKLSELGTAHGLKETEIAIITPAGTVDAVKRLSGSALVFTPEDIKGLEYPCIVAYNPLNYAALREASKVLPGVEEGPLAVSPNRPKDKTNDGLHYAPYFNRVFVAFTRATQILVVFQSDSHPLRQLLGHLKTYLPGVVSAGSEESKESSSDDASPTSGPETTLDDWKKEVRRLHANGNLKQAKAVYSQYLQDDLGQSFEEFCAETSPTAASSQSQAAAAAVATPPPMPSKWKENKKRRKKKRKGQAKARKAAAGSPAESFVDFVSKLQLEGVPNNDGFALLKAIVNSPAALIRLLLELGSDPAKQDWFVRLVSPYFNEYVTDLPGSGKIRYLPYLIVKSSLCANLDAVWDKWAPYLSSRDLLSPIRGVDGVCENSSVFYYLCKHRREDLIQRRWEEFLNAMTPEALNRPITVAGEDQGMSPLFHLFISRSVQKCIHRDWDKIYPKITVSGLNRPVLADGNFKGASPLFFCTYEPDLKLLEDYWKDFESKITAEGLNQPYLGSPHCHGASVFFMLVSFEFGRKILSEHWDSVKGFIRHDGLNRAVDFNNKTDQYQNTSALYYLTYSEGGIRLLCEHWEDFRQHITAEGLNRGITGEYAIEGISPLMVLTGSVPGMNLLFENWSDFEGLITKEGLCRITTGESVSKGTSPVFYLCSSAMGLHLLFEQWDFFKDKLTPAVFNAVEESSGLTPFYLICRNASEALWQDYVRELLPFITADGMNQPILEWGEHRGESALFTFCGTESMCQIMLDNWDEFRPLVTQEGLNRPSSAETDVAGISPFYLLTSSQVGRKLLSHHGQDFEQLVTKEGLNHIVTGEGTQHGFSPLLYMCIADSCRTIMLRDTFYLSRIDPATLLHRVNAEGYYLTCALTPLCTTSSGREILRLLLSSNLVMLDKESLRTTLLTLTTCPEEGAGQKALARCLIDPPTTHDIQSDTQAFFINTLRDMGIESSTPRVSNQHLNVWTPEDSSGDGSSAAPGSAVAPSG